MTTLEKILFALLFVAVVVIGVMMYNMNHNMALIDERTERLHHWAEITAKWASHVNADHLKTDHVAASLAADHIQPPPDPPW